MADGSRTDVLMQAARMACTYLDGVAFRPAGPDPRAGFRLDSIAAPMPAQGRPASEVIGDLARALDPGLVASAGPRYFGFVTGGALDATVAADWLVSAWDQNPATNIGAPAIAALEDLVAAWLLELLDLPRTAGVGFVTGCQMANFTALAAARHHVLAAQGWPVEERGLSGAPPITLLVSAEAHATIDTALAMLGLGRDRAQRIDVDGQGRMRPQALAERLLGVTGPIIVCAQAGNVNTGAFDPVGEIAALTRRAGAWLHVDGAFGLWARASGRRQALGDGLERADSWATDAHKYLNVPYDSGLVFVANRDAHRAAMSTTASYLLPTADRREPLSWVPESSRRARVVPIFAALATLGRDGVAALVDRCADLAQRMAARLSAAPGITILNDVVLNQVLVRFAGPDGRSCSAEVIAAVQREGTCWAGSSAWQGETVMRISVSNWSTSESDIDRSADAIAACHARVVRDLASA